MGRPIKKLIILKCSHCNKEFRKYPSQVKSNKNTVFCGNECVTRYRNIHWKGKIIRNFIECGNEFKIYESELKKCKSAGKYCSKICQSKRNKIIECVICKKQFKIYLSDIKVNKKYCSKKCYNSRTNIIEHFFKSISDKNHPTNCWIWTGRKDKDGYGILYINRNFKAHRYSWILHNGNIPDDMIICHKCDNSSCVNPKHIYVGTHADNSNDRKNKGKYKDEL